MRINFIDLHPSAFDDAMVLISIETLERCQNVLTKDVSLSIERVSKVLTSVSGINYFEVVKSVLTKKPDGSSSVRVQIDGVVAIVIQSSTIRTMIDTNDNDYNIMSYVGRSLLASFLVKKMMNEKQLGGI